MNKTLVFTDMDGTLLDHHTYSFEAAKPALSALESKSIPVIPTTSKTFAELQPLRERIGLDGPFIVENGAAIFIPHGFF
jgi:mannosyl-3-phosphoglycerate phosphatase